MTSDVEDQLRVLLTSAEHDLPADAFTAGVSARLRAHRRQTRLLQGSGLLTTMVVLWLLAPDIARGAAAMSGFPTLLFGFVGRSVRTFPESSLFSVTCLYGAVFAGFILLRVLRQFRIGWV